MRPSPHELTPSRLQTNQDLTTERSQGMALSCYGRLQQAQRGSACNSDNTTTIVLALSRSGRRRLNTEYILLHQRKLT